MEYGTIKIPKEEYDKHNERRQNLGQTWAEYIAGNAPDAGDPDVDYAEIERRCERAVESALPNR